MNHSSIGEIFHIDCQGEGGSPGGIGPGTVPARRLQKRRNQKGGYVAGYRREDKCQTWQPPLVAVCVRTTDFLS